MMEKTEVGLTHSSIHHLLIRLGTAKQSDRCGRLRFQTADRLNVSTMGYNGYQV